MATEKQIAANRANAKRSTGPKTAAGRLKSSRTAYRHGLSCTPSTDPTSAANVYALAQALSGDGASEERLTAATELALAQVELLQIRAVRARIMEELDPAACDVQELARLIALDRYERFAHTRRNRAARKL